MFELDIWDAKLHNTIMYVELKKVFEVFEEHKYAVIKGEPLSIYAYKHNGYRHSRDIDVLIPRSDISDWEKVLNNNNLKPLLLDNYTDFRKNKIFRLSLSHQLIPYVNEMKTFSVDLNFDIFWGEYEGERINIDDFLSDTIEMEIYGVKVKTLSPIKSLIQLMLHHYKDMNSIFLLATRKSIKYDMFKEVYYLLKNNLDTISLDLLYEMSEKYGIIPYVFYVLYYTGQLFDDETLRKYIDAFRTLKGEALLNCYGLCAKEQKEWKCDFKTRLETDNLYNLIKDDLTKKDREKINFNKRVFMGVEE